MILLMALGTAGFYGIVYSNEPIQETVNYNTGDFNQIAGAKLRADAYERRTPIELNYSTNIRALEMGPQGGEDKQDGNEDNLGWPESIPSYEDELKPEYLEAVAEHLRSQNKVIWCSTPSIKNVTTYNSGKSRFEANIEDAWITCRSGLKDGSRPTVATVNISDTLQTSNPKNKYLVLANYAERFAKKARELINDKSSSYWTADGDSALCGSAGEAASKALDDAKGNLPTENFARKAYTHDDFDGKPDYLEKIDLSTTHKKVKVFKSASADGPCGPRGESTYHEGEAEAEISELTMNFAYRDKENEVIYRDGSMKNINFSFTYKVNP